MTTKMLKKTMSRIQFYDLFQVQIFIMLVFFQHKYIKLFFRMMKCVSFVCMRMWKEGMISRNKYVSADTNKPRVPSQPKVESQVKNANINAALELAVI